MSNLEGIFGEQGQQEMADEARGEFTVLPPGWYTVVILKAQLEDTQSGGKMVVVEMETTAGEAVKDRLNVVNNSEKAQLIGRQKLAKLGICAGAKQLTDTMQLIGLQLDVKLKVEEFTSNTTGKKLKSNSVADYAKAGDHGGSASPTQAKSTDSVPW